MDGRRYERAIPKKPNGRGYPRIKRSFGVVRGVHVGRINVSAGTDDKKTYRRLHQMLDDLAERGESEVLIRIRDSVVRTGGSSTSPRPSNRHHEILEIYRSWKNNRHIANITGWRPLADSMSEWLDSARTVSSGPLSPRTRKSYRCNIAQLLKFADGKGGYPPTDAQLPELLEEYREHCFERKHFVPFNQVKTMCCSYARETQPLRRDSDLYLAIRRVPGLSTTRKRQRKIMTVRKVREIMSRLPAREAQHLWNMCCLSIRPDEYARAQWEIIRDPEYGDYVLIQGTKTDNAVRPVPLAVGVAKVRYAETTFRRRFREAVGSEFVPRDCRSTGKNWRTQAGIDETRCLQYFAHSTSHMKHRYDTDELLPHVAADAARLNAYIAENDPVPQSASVDISNAMELVGAC
jgi:integrase